MLRAGSLYFALFISFMVTILLGSMILCVFLNNRYADMRITRDIVMSNADAGITLALYDTALFAAGNPVVYDLYGESDSIDKIMISKTNWGMYQIIKSTAQFRNFGETKIALAGADINSGEAIAMYVADNNRYLSFSGETVVKGDCYLPKLGARKAYVEGYGYNGDKLIYGETNISTAELPRLNGNIISDNLAEYDLVPGGLDDAIEIDKLNSLDHLERPFSERTLTAYSPNVVYLDNIDLKGNIKVISSLSVHIAESVKTDNILVYARSVYIEDGFKGNLQAFARDTLLVGANCEFGFPTCLGVIDDKRSDIYLDIDRNSLLEGSIIVYQKYKSERSPYLKIGEGSTVHGQVFCQGNVELKGEIEGTLYCEGLILKTASGIYENYLLNARVDRSALSEYYVGSSVVGASKYYKNIEWLY